MTAAFGVVSTQWRKLQPLGRFRFS